SHDAGLWSSAACGDCPGAGHPAQAFASRRAGSRTQFGGEGGTDYPDQPDSGRARRIRAFNRARYGVGDEDFRAHQRARPWQDDRRGHGEGNSVRPKGDRSLSGTGRRRGSAMSTSGNVILRLSGLEAGYGHIRALEGISLEVREGQIVTLLGANGAGKSTTLKTISGLVRASAGTVEFMGEDITRKNAHDIARTGLVHVPEGRHILR